MELLTRKFTVNEYEKMGETGILTSEDKVELIKGEIIKMSPIGLKHLATVNRLNKFFYFNFPEMIIVGVQNSIELNDNSQPEPDVVLLKYRQDFYQKKRPSVEDILLLIEVSDSSLKYDQEIKLPLYAENNIEEVWLINLIDDCVEVYRNPKGKKYQQINILDQENTISCVAFSEITINISDFFN